MAVGSGVAGLEGAEEGSIEIEGTAEGAAVGDAASWTRIARISSCRSAKN